MKEAFDPKTLSAEAREAYESLLRTRFVEDSHVGYAGKVSTNAINFEMLLSENQADAAFGSLFQEGSVEARVYGLSGLFFTDREAFTNGIAELKRAGGDVARLTGCLAFSEPVADFVERSSNDVAIIEPEESFEKILDSGRSFSLDVAHGGFPTMLVYYARKEKEAK